MPQKPISFTAHAEDNLKARSISRAEIEETILNPDREEDARPPRRVASRQYFDDLLNKEMLLRVVIEKDDECISVITLYKTSKITKYLVP
jgi:hypothetical protein